MSTFLKYEQRGHVVTLTMLQAEQRNPLTGNTAVPEFLAAVDRITADHGVRAVILTGDGPAFSAGGDIRKMKEQSFGEVDGMRIREDYRQGIQRLPLALFNLEVPVIAAINGPAVGAGLDLACMCDMRIAGESARRGELRQDGHRARRWRRMAAAAGDRSIACSGAVVHRPHDRRSYCSAVEPDFPGGAA